VPYLRTVILSTSILFCSITSQAQSASIASSRTPTIDKPIEMHSVSSPQISPDGRHVVYEQSRAN